MSHTSFQHFLFVPGRSTGHAVGLCGHVLAWAYLTAMLVGCVPGGPPQDDVTMDMPGPLCDPGSGAPKEVAGFQRFTVEAAARGPAWFSAADVNGDGRLDLILSEFGEISVQGSSVTLSPGRVTAYLQGDSLGCWRKQSVVAPSEKIYFPNNTTTVDVDGDGDTDIILGAGFFVCAFDNTVRRCGALSWFENQDSGVRWKRHDIIEPGDSMFYHQAVPVDWNKDGKMDLVTVAETGSDAITRIFPGDDSPSRFSKMPFEVGHGLGSLPIVHDIDGDGDFDIAGAEYFFRGDSFAWFEQVGQTSFTRHVINGDSGRAIAFSMVPNLYGDGVLRAVGTNHTNTVADPMADESSVYAFSPSTDPRRPWQKTRLSTGIVARPNEGQKMQLAPGVFSAGDIDGDGDIDLAVSGDGDQRTFFLEQTTPGKFATHTIEEKLGQASGALVVNLDKRGGNEVVFCGFENNALYVYTR